MTSKQRPLWWPATRALGVTKQFIERDFNSSEVRVLVAPNKKAAVEAARLIARPIRFYGQETHDAEDASYYLEEDIMNQVLSSFESSRKSLKDANARIEAFLQS